MENFEENNQNVEQVNLNQEEKEIDLGKSNKIPYERFKKVNDTLKITQEKLNQILKEREEEKKKQLEEQQKFKELYEEASKKLEEFKSKNEVYLGLVKEELEKELSSLTEEDLSIINEFIDENLDEVSRLKKIRLLKQKILNSKKQILKTDTEEEFQDKNKLIKNKNFVNLTEYLYRIQDSSKSFSEKKKILEEIEELLKK